ncbi:hypothetical protein K7I13_01695 [Brucepastera parasyntrophica]|uniref:HEAT repeat domain-containing protein n=1 Tax=Brucepastera parasyntrophica TaxID=2880008 RepID=UPI00210B99D8|nr:HEAT repeat domain-containing protein [Brucepastera parasyntrophica]ULQ60067.1 hypothetical protein K7I13_01695 [Brucepastera parasyntrophica]
MMKKPLFIVLFMLIGMAVFSQSSDPVVLSYQRNFIRASISTKLELLNDAARIKTVNMTPLYVDALSFCGSNYPVLGNDSQLLEMIAIAARNSAVYNDPSVLPYIRSVFSQVTDSNARIACLTAMAELITDQKDEIVFLQNWFSSAISATLDGTAYTDAKVLAACARTLGQIGDPDSFTVLFRAATSRLDTSVVQAASDALNSITDEYKDRILAIIAQKNIRDIYSAFSFAMKNEDLPQNDKAEIAEAAFIAALETSRVKDGQDAVRSSVIRESMAKLAEMEWSHASPVIVQYFYQVQGDYKNEKAGVDMLIPVVSAMGAMGTTEAAQALSIFLGLLNSETEQKKTYNEQLMLAVIQALGDLGDKSAFDYLLYVGYLDYPETVKKASRDALARLQW